MRVSSLQSAFINCAAEEPGHALQSRYAQKWDKYGPKCEAEGMVFQPLPLEVLGGWHETGASLVKQIGQALARSSGQEECSDKTSLPEAICPLDEGDSSACSQQNAPAQLSNPGFLTTQSSSALS